MNKKTLYGAEARAKVLAGVKKIAAAVKVTLGPLGRNVLISQSAVIDYGLHSYPVDVTKDGYTVSKAFDLSDEPFEKAGVLMFKEAVKKTVDEAGDGTTTCGVFVEAIVEKGVTLINDGANPMELKRGIDEAVEVVVKELKKMATPIKGDIKRIKQIATVSANNDPEIGEWIAKAFTKIGDDGIIDLEASNGVNTEIKLADGYKWPNGWISPLFVNNKEKQITEFIEPLILLYEKKITHHSQVENALKISIQQGKPLFIICEDSDEEGLAFLVMNTIQQRFQCCVVKAPAFGYERRIEMEDLAILTGGTFISDSKGIGIKEVQLNNLGKAKKVIVSKGETVIIGGNSDTDKVEDLINELKMNLTQCKSEDEKLPIEKRIAKLKGGVAVIQVGAATETEMKEKLYRFDDAVRATKAAIAEGYISGGGSAFIKIKNKKIGTHSSIGASLINGVLDIPFLTICANAGIKDVDIMGYYNKSIYNNNIGYNAKDNKIEDLVKTGIIDPVKVLRCALQNAASSAGMILTSEVLICDTL